MSSTNKTTNYELSQFIGTDKPTYLGDYNGDMLKIDTQMKVNSDNISSVSSTATTANTNASTALTNAQTAQTTAETAQTTANNAQTSASQANLTAQQALAIAQLFNLTTFEDINPNNIVCSNGSVDTQASSISIAKNNDGSIGKIYGTIKIDLANISGAVPISFPTSLRPSSKITIKNAVMRRFLTSNSEAGNYAFGSIDINTNGLVEIYPFNTATKYTRLDLYLIPCLYWFKDFGDVPSPEL